LERQRLDRLRDALPAESPRDGLAARTLARLARAGEPRSPWRIPRVYALSALAATVILCAVLWPVFQASREAARRAASQDTMKRWALAFKMYAGESPGERWPGLAPGIAGWAPDFDGLLGDYVTDPGLFVSPYNPEGRRRVEALQDPLPDHSEMAEILGENYAYLGYAVRDVSEFDALHLARTEGRLAAQEKSKDAPLRPLREGVERFLITDINNPAATAQSQSTTPVLVEVAGWKRKGSTGEFKGANVAFMDGHVEFVPLGTFPVVPEVMDVLSGISDGERATTRPQ